MVDYDWMLSLIATSLTSLLTYVNRPWGYYSVYTFSREHSSPWRQDVAQELDAQAEPTWVDALWGPGLERTFWEVPVFCGC